MLPRRIGIPVHDLQRLEATHKVLGGKHVVVVCHRSLQMARMTMGAHVRAILNSTRAWLQILLHALLENPCLHCGANQIMQAKGLQDPEDWASSASLGGDIRMRVDIQVPSQNNTLAEW